MGAAIVTNQHASASSESQQRQQMRWHIKYIHDRAEGIEGVIILCWEYIDPRTQKSKFRCKAFPVGDHGAMAAKAIELAHRLNVNVWISWHVMRPGLSKYSRGTKEDIVKVLALPVDFDRDTGKAGTLPCEPTLDIITSEIPALNRQPIYVFDRPLDPGEAERLAKGLQVCTGSDGGTGDIAHIWRVAGTRNWPNEKKLERGRPKEPQDVRFSDAGTNELFDPEEFRLLLEEKFGKKLEDLDSSNRSASSGETYTNGFDQDETETLFQSLPPTLRKTIQDPPDTNDRSRDCNSVYWQLFHKGLLPDQASAALRMHPNGIAKKFIDRGGTALEEDITRVFEDWQAKNPTKQNTESAPNGEHMSGAGEQSSFEKEVERLASLSPLEYDQCRECAAKKLGVRRSVLDKEVQGLRRQAQAREMVQGDFVPPVPWEEQVNGAVLLDRFVEILNTFIALPDYAPEAISLWIMGAHAHDAATISVLLVLKSAEKRCGKTTTLKTLTSLVPKPLHTVNVSAAALFRLIEKFTPTMLIDEGDSFMKQSEDHRNLINGGHDRQSAYIWRCVGDDHEPTKFGVWCPKVIAQIGNVHPTTADRSIEITLKRRLPDEMVERLPRDINTAFEKERRKAARWAQDNLGALVAANPELPEGLDDRARDNWWPLIAIAHQVGGEWPERAREAALELEAVKDRTELDGYGVRLLQDIKKIFDALDQDKIPSSTPLIKLNLIEAAPWADWSRGRGLSARGLNKMLKQFQIEVFKTTQANVYRKADFEDAWSRYEPYLPPAPTSPSSISSMPLKDNGFSESLSSIEDECMEDEKSKKFNDFNDMEDMEDRQPLEAGERVLEDELQQLENGNEL